MITNFNLFELFDSGLDPIFIKSDFYKNISNYLYRLPSKNIDKDYIINVEIYKIYESGSLPEDYKNLLKIDFDLEGEEGHHMTNLKEFDHLLVISDSKRLLIYENWLSRIDFLELEYKCWNKLVYHKM